MKTNAVLILALALGLALAGCTGPRPPDNAGNNTTAVPPGYESPEYCEDDGDCVRLKKCCDCGLGEYVNSYHQEDPECQGPECKCATIPSHGKCIDNACVAVAGEWGDGGSNGTPSGFCGTSTGGQCASDSGCTAGGCSGQVCQSVTEPPIMTTCEYRDCYNAQAYGVRCACSGGRCGWQ